MFSFVATADESADITLAVNSASRGEETMTKNGNIQWMYFGFDEAYEVYAVFCEVKN